MKKSYLALLLLTFMFSCSDNGSDPDVEKEKDTYTVRYELTCNDPISYKIEIEYLEHSTNEMLKQTVESPHIFEQKLKGSHMIDITGTLVAKEKVEKELDGITLKIFINNTLKYEGTETKRIYKTIGVI